MSELRYRPLMTYDRTEGFLCDWHIAGPFEAGLSVDPNATLFQQKISTQWTHDHLAPWGGCAGITVPPAPCTGVVWDWDLAPSLYQPALSLVGAAREFPSWQEKLVDLHPDRWSKLYYALAVVDSPIDSTAELVFSGWDGCRLWINNQLAFEEHSYHHVIYDMERISFQLCKGLNTFLFQLDRDGVAARIELPGGSASLAQLRSVAFSPAPQARRLSTMAQLRRHALTQRVRMPFTGTTPDELRQWQEAFYAHYARCLGDAPVIAMRPDSPQLISQTPRDGYVERLYHVPVEGDCVLPCYVLVPDADRYNGRTLLTVHGHEDYHRLLGHPPHKPNGWNNYSQCLAQKGFLVGVTCQRGFSDRNDDPHAGHTCNSAAMLAAAQGLVLSRLQIADIQVLYDLLVSLPEVNADRLGITGLSGGASLTYLAAAYDKRFKAAAEFCGLCRYTEYATGFNGCGTQTVPGVFPTGDSGEILSLIAPRPLLLAQGRLDSTFHVMGVQSIAQDARRAYQAAGVPERLEVAIYERAHEYHPDLAEAFFLKWL